MKKFYAVRKGKATGIFTDWDECKKNIHGFGSAEYKSFGTLAEAERYMAGSAVETTISIPPPEGSVLAYVDGSFDTQTSRYSFGCVLLTPDGGQEEHSGIGNDPKAAENRNVAGELLGAMFAVRWASKNGYKRIVIRHDYEGIARWYTGGWKANSYSAVKYVTYMAQYKDIEIIFEKVSAHTGEPLNERVDQLAKEALGLSKSS